MTLRVFRAARTLLRAFHRDDRGNIALLSAIMMLPILMALGMGVDYALQRGRQDEMQGIADAAALSAVTPSMMLNTSTVAQTDAQNLWNAQSALIAGVTGATGTIKVTDATGSSGGTVRTVTVTYTAKSVTNFSSLVGFQTLPISGSSSSTMSSTPYINFYILIDNSQSMGIASTTTDMANLFSATQKVGNTGCVFGCHVTWTAGGDKYPDEDVAHNPSNYPVLNSSTPITLRIDSAKTAITTMISQAQSQGMSTYVKFALYTMGGGNSSSTTLLNQIASLSNNYTSLLTSVSSIDLETKSAQGIIGDTDIEDALTTLQSSLPSTNGTGLSASSPMNFIFIVTDGLDDFNYNTNTAYCLDNAPSPGGYRCTQLPTQSSCTSVKKSANIGVIYTTYLPLYNNNDSTQGYYSSYTSLVQHYSSSIPTNLQSCATNSNYYLVASDGPSIISAMTKLFNTALVTAHLTS